jgi:hypothetical protein
VSEVSKGAQIVRVMDAIAALVPLDDGSLWSVTHTPRWPQDYSRTEVALRRAIATAAVLAMRP